MSAKGLRLIGEFEGLRLRPYNDVGGNATIGYGHLLHRGSVTAADRKHYRGFTTSAALGLLRHDVGETERAINRYVTVPINQNRFDALASFVYNVGVGAFRNSNLLRKLNHSDYLHIDDELMKWTKAGGAPVLGLIRRRLAEAALFHRRAV